MQTLPNGQVIPAPPMLKATPESDKPSPAMRRTKLSATTRTAQKTEIPPPRATPGGLVLPETEAPKITFADPQVLWSHSRRTVERWGFSLVPVVKGGRAPAGGDGWNELSSCNVARTVADVDRMWGPGGQWWGFNVGVLHRPELHTLALDIDMKNGKNGEATLAALRAEYESYLGVLAPTLENHTPTGGRHLLYRIPDDWVPIPGLPFTHGRFGKQGIDILMNGKQNVLSPSYLNSTVNAPYRLGMPPVDPWTLPRRWVNVLMYGTPDPYDGDIELDGGRVLTPGMESGWAGARVPIRRAARTGPTDPRTLKHELIAASRLSPRGRAFSEGKEGTAWVGFVETCIRAFVEAGPGNWHNAYWQQCYRLCAQAVKDEPGSVNLGRAFDEMCAAYELTLRNHGWYDSSAVRNKYETWANALATVQAETAARNAVLGVPIDPTSEQVVEMVTNWGASHEGRGRGRGRR